MNIKDKFGFIGRATDGGSIATIGFSILVIGAILLSRASEETNDKEAFFAESDYYINEYSENAVNEKNVYESLTGSRSAKCPVIALDKTSKGLVSLAYTSKYSHTYWICNAYDTRGEANDLYLNHNSWNADASKGIVSGISDLISNKDGSFSDVPDNSYVEIIAPFSFNYRNCNTLDSDNIIIESMKGDIKITFSNVANWFCAGPIPEDEEELAEWKAHKTNHRTILGLSGNSKVTSGDAGDVIGYASNATTYIIEAKDINGYYRQVDSVEDWLTTE